MNQIQPRPRKSIFKRWWFWVIIVIAVLLFGAGVANKNFNKNMGEEANKNKKTETFEWPSATAKTITAVPFDLTQIERIGKFRSCAGHDRAGYNFDRVMETDRSMKHYLFPVTEFQGTTDKIKLLAPFDGKIVWVQRVSYDGKEVQEETLRKDGNIEKSPTQTRNDAILRINQGNDIGLVSPLDENAMFHLNHVQQVRDWQVGDEVKAGQLIGYASLNDTESDFDMDYVARTYKFEGEKSVEVLDSIFNHMTDPVLSEFAKYGITPENIIFTKEERDAKPCGYDPVTKYNSKVCNGGRDNECWVKLKH